MEAMIEALQDVVAAEPEPEVQSIPDQPEPERQPEPEPVIIQDEDAAKESRLSEEIIGLWSQHIDLSGNRRATGKELRILRSKLAERLFVVKQLLCRAGRGGQWRGWLKQRGIPRSSADRFCERHAEILGIKNHDAPSGATEQEETFERLLQSCLPRLKRTLPDTQSVFRFIAAVGEAFGLKSETTDDCVMLSQPKEQNEPAPSSTGAAEAVPADVTFPGTDAPSSEPMSTVGART
jgi:hypothetical protein